MVKERVCKVNLNKYQFYIWIMLIMLDGYTYCMNDSIMNNLLFCILIYLIENIKRLRIYIYIYLRT